MKFTNTTQKKNNPKPKVSSREEFVTMQQKLSTVLPGAYLEWAAVHNTKEHNHGKTTQAWCGMTWDCTDYLNVLCHCGSRFVQDKKGGICVVTKEEPVVTFEHTATRDSKNSKSRKP